MNLAGTFTSGAMDGGTSEHLRGDKITGDRYWCKDWMQREWDHMWTKVWHMGCKLSEIPQAGDYMVHNFRQESVLIVRQEDGGVKAFYNVCMHRGNRLVWTTEGSVGQFTCAYHGWKYALDGGLTEVQDPDNFRGGTPCGKTRLVELRCETWMGFAWYTMAEDGKSLRDYLDPLPTLLGNRDIENMVRLVWRKVDVDTNWKFASDNFNESYHLPTVHPQMRQMIDEDHAATIFEMYPNGHNRMIEKGRPSMRADSPNEVEPIWDVMLREWDLDPTRFSGRARDAREELMAVKRKSGTAKGHGYIEKLDDLELTDYFHHTMFPNITITATPVSGQVHLFRTEPHVTDPEKCTFEYMAFSPRIDGAEEVPTATGMRPIVEVECEHLVYGVDEVGDFIDQDLSIAVMQQKGLHSRGYRDAILSEQETRVRRFHEVLNDYLADRR